MLPIWGWWCCTHWHATFGSKLKLCANEQPPRWAAGKVHLKRQGSSALPMSTLQEGLFPCSETLFMDQTGTWREASGGPVAIWFCLAFIDGCYENWQALLALHLFWIFVLAQGCLNLVVSLEFVSSEKHTHRPTRTILYKISHNYTKVFKTKCLLPLPIQLLICPLRAWATTFGSGLHVGLCYALEGWEQCQRTIVGLSSSFIIIMWRGQKKNHLNNLEFVHPIQWWVLSNWVPNHVIQVIWGEEIK